jgi:hypothetical protein
MVVVPHPRAAVVETVTLSYQDRFDVFWAQTDYIVCVAVEALSFKKIYSDDAKNEHNS